MAARPIPSLKPVSGFSVSIMMVPLPGRDGSRTWEDAPWGALINLEGVTETHMRKGLFWTTENIFLSNSYYAPWRDVMPPFDKTAQTIPWKQDFTRRWMLFEFPDKPFSESRWEGSVSLFAHSDATLSEFCLGSLKREMIRTVVVRDEEQRLMFEFDADNPRKRANRLLLNENAFDLLWAWPMESILAKSSERGPESVQVAGKPASWKDVVVLVVQSQSVQTVASGIAWLLCFVGLALCVLALSLVAFPRE